MPLSAGSRLGPLEILAPLGATFEPGMPAALFEVRPVAFIPYDVAPDGRFLIATPAASASNRAATITVVLNWSAELNK